MAAKPTVALVDDDEAILDSLQLFLRRRGFQTSCFRAAKALLEAMAGGEEFDCVVTDVRMPGMDGLALHQALAEHDPRLPVIIITGHGDIDMAVTTVRAGAFDFIEKPIDDKRLASRLLEAVEQRHEKLGLERERADLKRRYAGLSNRQKQVMDFAIEGLSNKEIASRLSISPRTVEHYRESAMERMHASNFAHLIRMALSLQSMRQKD